MGDRRRFVSLLTAGALLGLALAAAPASAQTAKPASPAGRADHRGEWLSRIVLDELARAYKAEKLEAMGQRLGAAILARIRCGHLSKLADLNDMVYALRASRYIPMARAAGGKDLADWLAKDRAFSRLLYRALEEVPKPEDTFQRLAELHAAEKDKVQAYPELTVALATASPARNRRQENPATTLESFRWYTNEKADLRHDLAAMPYELAQYLADTRLSIAERKWARRRYGRAKNPAAGYFDVAYDYEHYRRGVAKQISKVPYTLQNLDKVGGVCIDQAYYASEVCKALGIPAAIVSGRGQSGIGHAWVACLVIPRGGGKARWDANTGRYRSHRYYTGLVRSPATGVRINDSELALAGAACRLPLDRREEADTAVTLARLVSDAPDDNEDVKPLLALAKLHDERFARKDGDKAVARWIHPARKLDLAVVEDLLAEAIERNLAHRASWELIVTLRRERRLPVDHLNRFFDVLVTRTAKDYPDSSCQLALQIVPTINDALRRVKAYKRSASVYRSRPDLQGRILIAIGDDYAEQGKRSEAIATYGDAALRGIHAAQIVLSASGRAEKLLVEDDKRKTAINMYEKLFEKARGGTDTALRRQSVRFQIGTRLAKLYMAEGDTQAADRILAKIGVD